MASVEFRGLTKWYGKRRGVEDLSLNIADKEFVVIFGPAGAGKTTTLNLIAGHGLTGIGRAAGTAFMVNSFHSGGAGARPSQDGLSATPFPSGVRNVPVEATEAITPLVIWRKELRQDRNGKSYLDLELTDKSGSISANVRSRNVRIGEV